MAGLNLKPDKNIKIPILSFWYTSGIRELRFLKTLKRDLELFSLSFPFIEAI